MKNIAMTLVLAITLTFVGLSTTYAADKFGADRHIARGLTCESCHGPDKANPVYPEETTCTGCHNKADVAKKTKALEPNPHTAPHNGDCTLCHMQHEPAGNYCAQCHNFNFKVR